MNGKLRRHFLKNKETKNLIEHASKITEIDLKKLFGGKVNAEVIKAEHAEVYLLNEKALLARVNETLFPTLAFKEYLEISPKVVVDMGAVPHICSGADVMAPGIRRYIGSFKKGCLAVIVDEKHNKPIAIGEVLFDANEITTIKHGRVVKNIHFVGDKIWSVIIESKDETRRKVMLSP